MLPKQRPQSKPPLLQKSVLVILVPSDEDGELVGSEDEPVADVAKVLESVPPLVFELEEHADSSPYVLSPGL